jgi:hypothetical protein
VLLDDRLLVEELLVGLPATGARAIGTSTYWYYRACRAAVAGAGGHLSGPFEQLDADGHADAILSLLRLREEISLPDPRLTVPKMAELALRHPRLNLMNLEAVASAQLTGAVVLLSAPTAVGMLPAVLDAEGVAWETVDIG